MAFDPFVVSPANLVYACMGGFIVLFSLFWVLIKDKLFVGEIVFATIFGIIIGPYGANGFDPRSWGGHGGSRAVTNAVTLEVMRVVIAFGVFAIGVDLPKAYMWRHAKGMAFLVVPVMFWGWILCAGLVYALFPGLNYLSALVVSATLTPTDPVLSAAIVGGYYAEKNVPAHIRQAIAAESAANDGLAYPFLFLALYLCLEPTTGQAITKWITVAILYQVVFGVALGSMLGYVFRKLVHLSGRHGYAGPESYVTQFVSLTLLSIGVATLLGSDDLLCAFAAGCAVNWDGSFHENTQEIKIFGHLVEVLLNCVCFVYIGAWIKFSDFHIPSLNIELWRLFVWFISILFLRRLPATILLYKGIPELHNIREAIFAGWFGPMGVGAVFISTMALGHLPEPQDPPVGQLERLAASLQPIVAFTVLCSIVVHGLSVPSLALGKRIPSIPTMSTMSKSNRNNAQPEWTNATRRVPNGEDANNDNQQSHPTSPIGDIEKGEMSEFNVGGASRKGTTDTDLTMTTVTERDEKRRHDGQLPSPSTSSTIYVTDGVEDVNPNGHTLLGFRPPSKTGMYKNR